ncbi:hypothetical protein P3S68_005247 [Capsicum galapagoense]
MIIASSNEPSSSGDDGDGFNILEFSLWAPLFFVQVWAWERLVTLRPEQVGNYNMVSGVRIGRRHNVKQSGVINVRTTIDSSGETFQWRLYALAVEGWLIPKFYKEKEEWTINEGQNLDQELESFVRCLRVSELVGFDFQELYLPNRVAMRFGYDQDFPKWIARLPSKERKHTLTYHAHESNGSSSVGSPKCNAENQNANVSMMVCQTVACDIVPPGLMEKCNAGKSIYASTDAHDSNENSSVVPPKCTWVNEKENLSMEVCLTVACDAVPPDSTEKHTDCEHDRNDSNSNIAHNPVVYKQKSGERTSCDDLIMAIELRLSKLKRQSASCRRY